MINRTYCAMPVPNGATMKPCGMFARVVAAAGSTFTWAYCDRHAERELSLLDLGISQAVAVGADATDRMRKVEALRAALGNYQETDS